MNNNQYCTFYIVRHGETDMNVSGLIQGHIDSLLTDKGRKQAQQVSEELKTTHFDAIFSSDLKRAKDTADIIAKEQKLQTKTLLLLRERNWGRLEGQPREVLKDFNDIFQSLSDSEKAAYKSFEEVESDNELANRFIAGMREIAVSYPGKTVLLVSHGSAIGTFLMHIGFWSYTHALPKIPNGAYIRCISDGTQFIVEEIRGFSGIVPRALAHADR